MHLILTGATGLIGSAVLDAMLQNQGVTKISILSRRAVKMADDRKDPRVRVILHSDFNKYDDALLAQLRDAQGCVWALGISQTQVDKDEYVRITKDYALAAAKAFQTLPAAQPSTSTSASPPNPTTSPATTTTPNPEPPFNFIFVSGYGATTSPPRFPPPRLFARVKGETELALAALRNNVPGKSSNFHACSVRPCAVDPGGHAAIQPYVPPLPPILRYGGVAPALRWGVRTFMDGLWSPTPALGRFLTEVAMGRHGEALRGMAVAEKGEENREREGGLVQMVGEFPIVENQAFRRLVAK
ncbi:putative nucleoside-diphosphate-sugar epimerase [Xylariaceae sp. FL0804]|nr:putative nucleoside-diphosphate-sugar epimerase [Xylariaceae sp. FL0804]